MGDNVPVEIVKVDGSARIMPTWALAVGAGGLLWAAGAWAADISGSVKANAAANKRHDVAIEKIADKLDSINSAVQRLVVLEEKAQREAGNG